MREHWIWRAFMREMGTADGTVTSSRRRTRPPTSRCCSRSGRPCSSSLVSKAIEDRDRFASEMLCTKQQTGALSPRLSARCPRIHPRGERDPSVNRREGPRGEGHRLAVGRDHHRYPLRASARRWAPTVRGLASRMRPVARLGALVGHARCVSSGQVRALPGENGGPGSPTAITPLAAKVVVAVEREQQAKGVCDWSLR